MSNPYYNATPGVPLPSTRGDATQIQNEFAKVGAGFDALPSAARLYTNSAGYVADTGGANAFFLTGIPGLTSYLDGMEVLFKAANTVTGATTINVNGLGAKAVKRTDGTPLQAGDIVAGQIVSLRFSASADTFQFFSSATGAAAGAATAAAASASQAQAYRDTALAYRDAASGYAGNASTSATQAQGFAGQSQTYSLDAKTYRDQAQAIAGGGVISFNGQTGAVSYSAPVTSVNGQTGAVTVAAGSSAWSAITGKPTTLAGYGITDARSLPKTTASTQTYNVSDADQEVYAAYPGQQNIVLPNSVTSGRVVRVTAINGRADVAVYVNGASAIRLIVGASDVYAGEYTLLNWPGASVEFELKDTWRPN